MAVNCCGSPAPMDGFAGVTAIDTNWGALTVRAAEPLIEPTVAETVVAPTLAETATPRLLVSLLIEATPGFAELHVTEASVCVLLSLKVPVAVNCWTPPSGIDTFA